jgi:hypothetical protein
VRGLLDLAQATPRILPRLTDDIVLISHAESSAAATSAPKNTSPFSNIPPWVPFGSAAATIAAIETAKHLHKRYKEKKLLAHPMPHAAT